MTVGDFYFTQYVDLLRLITDIFKKKKIKTMEMDEKYFVAKITFEQLDSETGKIKKIKEEKLVKGFSPTDVEAKVTKMYEGFTQEWRITAIVESKINEVIE
mgnify:FL=1